MMDGAVWRGIWAVVQFEGRRSMTYSRLGLWLVLSGFPVAIITLALAVNSQSPAVPNQTQVWQFAIFVLTQVTVGLSCMLWAAPSLQVELENRTWIYSATRPYGRRNLLLGRFVVAVLWAMSVGGVSVVVCSVIAGVFSAVPALLAVTLLSCGGFAALFTLLAVLFPKRAMSLAFAIALIFEVGVALIPALIRELTIEYHLRCLLGQWLWADTPFILNSARYYGEGSPLQHLAILLLYVVVLLIVSVITLENKELPTDEL